MLATEEDGFWFSKSHSYSSSEYCSAAYPQKPRLSPAEHGSVGSPAFDEIEKRSTKERRLCVLRLRNLAAELAVLSRNTSPDPAPEGMVLWGHDGRARLGQLDSPDR